MNKHVMKIVPTQLNTNIACDIWEFKRARELEDRRLYLYGEIAPIDCDCHGYADASLASMLIEQILDINRMDEGIKPEEREPIRLYINSPGGDVTEGLALISAIELSETPVYTINVGEWSSMAFLIGITGHRRFSLPYSTFLLHDGSIFIYNSANKVKDRVAFENRIEEYIVKPHVLKHSNMLEDTYDELDRKEFYMLPTDAMKFGFIDEVLNNFDSIF